MFLKRKDEEDSSESHGRIFSKQSKAISNAMKKADEALDQEAREASNMDYRRYDDDLTVDSTIKTREGMPSPPKANHNVIPTAMPPPMTISTSAPVSHGNGRLDLKTNDAQFQVFATLIISKFENALKTKQPTITISLQDKTQLDRMVSRDNFVEAVQHRIKSLPTTSSKPIHVLTRQCQTLGLHKNGKKNLLFAPVGTSIKLEHSVSSGHSIASNANSIDSKSFSRRFEDKHIQESVERQQLVAELREASSLLEESKTHEAAQFWRSQVMDLQKRLQELHETPGGSVGGSTRAEAERLFRKNQQVLAKYDEEGSQATDYSSTIESNSEETHQTKHTLREPTQPELIQALEDQFNELRAKSEAAANQIDPESQRVPMVDVVAPANLPEGYTFEAEINYKRFLATVPVGGVKRGQTFSCYMRDLETVTDIPMFRFRDGLFDIFQHGYTHPMLVLSFLCPVLALAQVMTRMGLDFTGKSDPSVPRGGLFSTWGICATIVGFWSMLNAFIYTGIRLKSIEGVQISAADMISFLLVNIGMLVYTIIAAANTRAAIREKYKIKDQNCKYFDDVVTSAVCLPFAIAQMGRHTISYQQNNALFCSDTGLESGVESDLTSRRHVGSYRLW